MPALTAPPIAPAADPTPDNVTKYFARVDKHVEAMSPAERLAFYRRDRIRWIALEEEFAQRIDRGEFPKPGEHAVTYLLIVAELGARLRRAEEDAVPAHAQDGFNPEGR
jgi:hypothetical protein